MELTIQDLIKAKSTDTLIVHEPLTNAEFDKMNDMTEFNKKYCSKNSTLYPPETAFNKFDPDGTFVAYKDRLKRTVDKTNYIKESKYNAEFISDYINNLNFETNMYFSFLHGEYLTLTDQVYKLLQDQDFDTLEKDYNKHYTDIMYELKLKEK